MAQDGSKSEKARKHKTLIFLRFWKDFGLLGGPKRRLEALWKGKANLGPPLL